MNIMICSIGRRTSLVEYFKKELAGIGKVVAADCSSLAPALYYADRHHIVPRIDEPSYIDAVKSICICEKVRGVLSLIDPELSVMAGHKEEFESMGISAVVSSYEVCEMCLDKYAMYEFCIENGFRSAKTYKSVLEFEMARNDGIIDFPVFTKPRFGSASIGTAKIFNMEELKAAAARWNDILIQEYFDCREYGVDAYVDMISGRVISIFIKEKLAMRSGETDKAVSVKDPVLFELIEDFIIRLGALGPLDIDIFKKDGEYYISEVNPRFGGGYPLAYNCGCNFPKYIINNLMGIENSRSIGEYREGVTMLKHDGLIII